MELLEGTKSADRPKLVMAGELYVVAFCAVIQFLLMKILLIAWGLILRLYSLGMENDGAHTDVSRTKLCQ